MVEVAGGEEIFHLIVSQLDAVLHQQRPNVDPVKPALFLAIAPNSALTGASCERRLRGLPPAGAGLGASGTFGAQMHPGPFGVVLSGSRTRKLTDFLD